MSDERPDPDGKDRLPMSSGPRKQKEKELKEARTRVLEGQRNESLIRAINTINRQFP